ncbi:MAG: CDP-alcohol phosphatidyltransferase family protein [Stellaceae bacterium]
MTQLRRDSVDERVGLNLPNMISLGRLLLVPLAIWLILRAHYGIAFWVFVVAGVSDALDGFIAKHFDRRTRLGALLDPIADKALLVSMFVTLGLANQLWTSLVILVVFRDVMIIGGFLLIQAFSIPKRYDPLYISKINTGLQIALIAFVLARLGLGADPSWTDAILSYAVMLTTILSGFLYLVRWTRILANSEPTC